MAVIQQQDLPLRNSSASTSDWIGQAKGRAIYAYDLVSLVSTGAGGADFTKEAFDKELRKVSRRTKPSEPDQA